MGRLSGKFAIITGAARGIGAGIARRYAAEGCALALCDLNAAGVEAFAAELRAQDVEVLALGADVTQRDSVQKFLDAAVAQFGQVDVLVNNAGIFFNAVFEDMSDEQWESMLKVNVTGVFLPSQIVIRHWLANDIRGAIVNLASISSLIAFTHSAAYGTSKAAVAGLTRHIALQYGPQGIRANAMAPGIIDTSMLPSQEDMQRWAQERIPLRRPGTPEDVAELALFLACDESRYLTGTIVPVDGGWLLD
ncbi:MAG: SDR family NAD(P)-dependent oxidoreductase [Anaerolineaceae bacterium]|nr:SDR family NAD(P)-dependent oxidoreductase [Anaerolineaceae bacterium]MDE0329557.1 SDR family NAD(P)-dependent oxidoreductase [Anaerolineaceae bacterium]